MTNLLWIGGWLFLLILAAVSTVTEYRRHKREMKFLREETVKAKEELSKAKADAQAVEFERWIEATRDKCKVCNGNHLESDCPDLPCTLKGYEPYGALLRDDEEIDLTGPDPTELFHSEAMRRKRELKQFQESLNAELPEDHPKKRGK